MIVWEGFGNILEDKGSTQLCPINAMGAMGAGLALTMRKAYRDLHARYRDIYHPDFSPLKNAYARASLLTVVNVHDVSILLFCTKVHWQEPSPRKLVEGNLQRLVQQWEELGIKQLATPLIGSGKGKLPESDVRELLHEYLGPIELPVRIYLGT